VMESLIYLTEKKDGRIKARMCANSSTQQEYTDWEEAASPMAMTKSHLITAVVNAKQGRNVMTANIRVRASEKVAEITQRQHWQYKFSDAINQQPSHGVWFPRKVIFDQIIRSANSHLLAIKTLPISKIKLQKYWTQLCLS
jgi:hypothetical protein